MSLGGCATLIVSRGAWKFRMNLAAKSRPCILTWSWCGRLGMNTSSTSWTAQPGAQRQLREGGGLCQVCRAARRTFWLDRDDPGGHWCRRKGHFRRARLQPDERAEEGRADHQQSSAGCSFWQRWEKWGWGLINDPERGVLDGEAAGQEKSPATVHRTKNAGDAPFSPMRNALSTAGVLLAGWLRAGFKRLGFVADIPVIPDFASHLLWPVDAKPRPLKT